MNKYVQAYFRDEDEAEQLKASLVKFPTTNLMIDFLEDVGEKRLVVPYIAQQSVGDNTGNMTFDSQAIGYQDVEKEDREVRNTVVSFEVPEKHFYDVILEIQKLDGHVDRSLFE
ncbi:MAG: hypothetical protein GX972_00645 [Amphibacillus sp.]|nr:hypothetical protein [Amphibacillus sp.]